MRSRRNLSDELVSTLRAMAVDGVLPAGKRLNEVHLAERLDVSRTPLREALIRLVGEGFVEQIPRRGFFVLPLDPDEVADLYALRAILDPAALSLAGRPSDATLQELRALNDSIEAAAGDPARTIALDEEWHRLLLAHCPNRVLLGEIDRFMDLTRRYEHAYFRSGAHVAIAVDEHERILAALEADDLEAARRRLERNMQSAVDPIVVWLRARS